MTSVIEALRFASGDEEIRSVLYDKLGDKLFYDFQAISAASEQRLSEWSDSDPSDSSDSSDEAAPKSLPERTRKKLLDPKTPPRPSSPKSTSPVK